MMETSKSVGRNKKNLPSFARNGASTATLSAFMRTWRLFVVLGMSFDQGWKTCVLRMMVAYCGEFAGRFSTKIPWKFTKLTWWNHQNEESKTSTSTVQFTQSLGDNRFTVVFSMTQPADLFFIGSAGGSASVPGSVMVGKPQRPTHQDGHFQTKKQGAQLTSEGELIRIPLEIFLRNFGGWKFPLEFSGTHSNFRLHRLSSHRLLLWCFFPRWGPDSETRGYWWRGGVFQIVASKMMTCRCVFYMPPKNMEAGELSTDDDATMLRAGEIFWVELLAYGNVGRGQYWSLLWMFVSPCEPQVSWMEFSPH